jgi:hypothetical protein
MKKYFALVICLLSFTVNAGQKAVTDEGDIVILKSDKTWVYENNSLDKVTEILLNKNSFAKGKESTFTLKSKVNDAEFSIDPKAWSFKKGKDDEETEYSFKLKGKDLYGMAITEGIEIDVVILSQIALQNAKDVAPDAKITKQEYRIVNDNKVIYQEMDATIQGMKIKYLGYYYSDKSGSTQYLTYTGASLFDKYKPAMESFLNGFSIQ